jgi:hypothetical protein
MAVPPEPDNIVRLVVQGAQEVTEAPAAAAKPARSATPSGPPPQPSPSRGEGNGDGAAVGRGDNDGGSRGGAIKMHDGTMLPIVPLGIHGETHFYLDASRQLRGLTSRDHQRLGLLALFGTRSDLLYRYFPRTDRKGDTTGWRPEECAELLMKECARRGIWNGAERERGVGAWADENGGLVLHCGDAVLYRGQWREPGAIYGRHVYPAASPTPRPAPEPAGTGPSGPAETVLSMLKTWRWKKPETSPHLLLGWQCAAMVGGALDWRPMAWVTGGPGTGKTTLQKKPLALVLDDGGLVAVSDSSAAGIWQKLGKATLPVLLDEQEAEEDNRKGLAVIKLARQAASGGVVLRGGASHEGAEFQARSCFLFSSILVPPLPPQDRSRMAILELEPLLPGQVLPALEPAALAVLGGQLRRRMVDQWHRLPATLEAYRLALAVRGHSSRGADQFGTILACLDLAMSDEMPTSDTLELWADLLAPSDEDLGEENSDQYSCLNHLLTSAPDVHRSGIRRTVGDWIEIAIGRRKEEGGNGDPAEANLALALVGVKVAFDPKDSRWWFMVANAHRGLEAIFASTKWAGKSGTIGVWIQSLKRLTEAQPSGPQRYSGAHLRGVKVPLMYVMPDMMPGAPVGAAGGASQWVIPGDDTDSGGATRAP